MKPKVYLNNLSKAISEIDCNSIQKLISLVNKSRKNNKKILTIGNGGSALTAQHFITDWNKFINLKTLKPFRGLSLVDNIGIITAYANDISYEDIFVEQIKNIYEKGDLLIAISGSGNSHNIIKAVEYCNSINANVFSLIGYDGGKLKKISKNFIHININDMQIVEDIHLSIGHIVMKSILNEK
jgi:D-sedoheptulose 7-phosphate isomerase